MKPLYLALKDFTNHGESFIDFTDLPLATIIIGMEGGSENASNGTGKTNIFNAIKYALFNSKISNVKEKIIRDGTSKCQVEFVFQLSDNSIYKIQRIRTKTTQLVKLFTNNNDVWKDISEKTSSQTDAAISKIIGISEQTFENSSYLKQNDFKRRKIDTFASATPEDRKSIIIDMLQLHMWKKYEDKAKEIRDLILLDINKFKAIIENIGEPKEKIIENNKNIKLLESNIENLSNKINAVTLDLQEKIDKKNVLSRSLSSEYPDLLKDLQIENNKLQKIINDKKIILNSNKKYNDELNKLIDNINLIDKNIISYEKELNILSLIELKQNIDNDLPNILNEISKTKANIRENKSLLSIVNKPIPKTDYCNECGTELNESYKENLLQNKKEKALLLSKFIEDNQNLISKLELDKFVIENNITKYNEHNEKINKLNILIQKSKNLLIDNNVIIENKKNIIISNDESIKEKDIFIRDMTNNIKSIEEKLKLINYDTVQNEILQLNDNIENISRDLVANKKILSTNIYDLAQSNAFLEIAQKDYDKLQIIQNELKECEKKYTLYKGVVSCFCSSGIPAMIIHNVLDSIQDETNYFLDKLKPGLQIKFIISNEKNNDTLDINYYINSVEKDFMDLSGGQQACAVLAFKLATANISRKRKGSDIRMLLLDEVDQALDRNSIDHFYDIINELSKDDINILIITHNEQLKNKFNTFILVNKENDISTAIIKRN